MSNSKSILREKQKSILREQTASLSYVSEQHTKMCVGVCQAGWLTPLVPALRRQGQADLWELGASLVYKVSSKIVSATQKLCLEKSNKQTFMHLHGMERDSIL